MIASFLLAIVLIIFLGIYLYNWSLNTVKNEIINSSTAQVSFYLTSLEEEIERIKILQHESLTDEYLGKLAVRYSIMDEYEIMESMRKLHQRLVTIHNSSSYTSNVSAHILPIQKTISSTATVSPIDMDKFDQIRVPAGETGAQLVQYKNNLYITTLHTENAGLPQKYMIEIELDTTAFQEALGQFHTYDNSGSYLIDLTHDIVISGKGNDANVRLQDLAGNYHELKSGNVTYSNINGQKMYVVSVKSDYLNMLLLRYIPQELIFVPLRDFYIWLWVFTGAGAMIMLFYSIYTYNLIHKPMRKLVGSFRHVESGNFNVSIHVNSKNEFGYLYQGFNSMVQNVSALIEQVYKQKILNQRAELKQLQSQISPHFLYNSLFLINTMAKLGDDNLIPFTKLLGDYFQFITRNASDFLPLREEVEHARTYSEIQFMRFPSRLTIQFEDLPDEVKEIQVPRLILQPILENAFKYAVEQTKVKGLITMRFQQEDRALRIIVEDNGTDLSESKLSALQKLLNDTSNIETSGLINIHRRLRLIYGDEHGLFLERSAMGGLKVTLQLDPKASV
ncbi:sensor histidine kinase [Paenibacillus sp. Y412MC10]|uniref:sensor histidine kinase n=1 Tax=Geobacillus sp. (strain Y412MC10) TaxID=481743 RepID=UPI0011A20A7B|nr:histidine kinase [Paenibacillus sp. Y412MC10]